jgi:hypothetical protein
MDDEQVTFGCGYDQLGIIKCQLAAHQPRAVEHLLAALIFRIAGTNLDTRSKSPWSWKRKDDTI